MQSAFKAIKPLLIRWVVAYLTICLAVVGWAIEIMADSPKKIVSAHTSIVKPSLELQQQNSQTLPSYIKAKSKKPVEKKPAKPKKRPAIPGNDYTPGNCTWYAKSKRPDLPNNLGNADTWFYSAKEQRIPTGSKPKKGAIGQSGMHVVYVEKVNKNGTILISEMNRLGLGVISKRTMPANSFIYIY